MSKMKNVVLFTLLLVMFGELITLAVMRNEKSEERVLSEVTVSTPEPLPVETSTPTAVISPTPNPTPKPTPVKTPTPIPQPKFTSEQINEFIGRFSSQYGIDPNVLRYIALCESGFNPNAYNAGYAGLYQFGVATWKNMRGSFGEEINPDLRYNAEEAVQTAAYAISIGRKGIWPNCYP